MSLCLMSTVAAEAPHSTFSEKDEIHEYYDKNDWDQILHLFFLLF
jgi:hypothetical protein